MTLSISAEPTMRRWADVREPYRYVLGRAWGLGDKGIDAGHCLWVMLNPSTADALDDDATIRRCIRFSRDWGFSGLEVVNLFAWRATDPGELFTAWRRGDHITGAENAPAIRSAAVNARRVLLAWGNNADLIDEYREHRRDVVALIRNTNPSVPVSYLRKTKLGNPEHPLRLPADLRPQPWP